MSDFNDSDPAQRSDLEIATPTSGRSTPEIPDSLATDPRASMVARQRIGRDVSRNPSTGTLTKSVRNVGRVPQSAEGKEIRVRLKLNYEHNRTSEWLRRVLAEARAYRAEKDLEGAIQR